MEINKGKIFENFFAETKINLTQEEKNYLYNLTNLICDTSVNSIMNLSEKQTFVLRKRLGVFDDGIIQSLRLIGENLDEPKSIEAIRMILKKSYRMTLAYIHKMISLEKSKIYEEHIRSQNSDVLDTPIEDLDLSIRAFNSIKRIGISTIGDLIKLSTDNLQFMTKMSKNLCYEIVKSIHNRGLLFADEIYTNEVCDEKTSKQSNGTIKK